MAGLAKGRLRNKIPQPEPALEGRMEDGFQYTPVDSIATWVQPSACSQSRRASSSRVVVPS